MGIELGWWLLTATRRGILLKALGNVTISGVLTAKGGIGGIAGGPDYVDGYCIYSAEGGGGGGGGRIKIARNPCAVVDINPVTDVSGNTGGYGYYGYGQSGSDGTSTIIDLGAVLDGGAVKSDQTICNGSSPSPFISSVDASGGSGLYVYQWMSCTSGCTVAPTNFSNISGATASTYTPGALGTTTYFVRAVTSGNCASYSNILSVTVVDPPTAPTGIAPADTVICNGGKN